MAVNLCSDSALLGSAVYRKPSHNVLFVSCVTLVHFNAIKYKIGTRIEIFSYHREVVYC